MDLFKKLKKMRLGKNKFEQCLYLSYSLEHLFYPRIKE